jgi:hypothetical protein
LILPDEVETSLKLFVIPGEDPGSSANHHPLQRLAACNGSRLKAGMKEKTRRG